MTLFGQAKLNTLFCLTLFGLVAVGSAAAGTTTYHPQTVGSMPILTFSSVVTWLRNLFGFGSQTGYPPPSGIYYTTVGPTYVLTEYICGTVTTTQHQAGAVVQIGAALTCNSLMLFGWQGSGSGSYSYTNQNYTATSHPSPSVTMGSNITETAVYGGSIPTTTISTTKSSSITSTSTKTTLKSTSTASSTSSTTTQKNTTTVLPTTTISQSSSVIWAIEKFFIHLSGSNSTP
jgi:hypothetical protein